jgi:uncharacterized membrane protein YphA (DoxX/SURF4 family)
MADSQRSRGVTIVSALVALVFLGSGAAKLIGAEPLAETFARFGFGMGFMRFIGAAEVAGAVGLFLPRLAPLAAACLMPIMCGAVYHHLVHDPIPEAVPPALLLVLCGYLAYARRGELRG